MGKFQSSVLIILIVLIVSVCPSYVPLLSNNPSTLNNLFTCPNDIKCWLEIQSCLFHLKIPELDHSHRLLIYTSLCMLLFFPTLSAVAYCNALYANISVISLH